MPQSKKILLFNFIIFFALAAVFSFGRAYATNSILPPSADVGMPDPPGGIAQILVNFTLWFLTIFGFLALIGFIISGVQYIAASGSEATIETAKRNMKYSLIGVIVGLSGYIVIRAVFTALTAGSIFF